MIGPARASNPDSPITPTRQRIPWRYQQLHRDRLHYRSFRRRFCGSHDPTNSVIALKDELWNLWSHSLHGSTSLTSIQIFCRIMPPCPGAILCPKCNQFICWWQWLSPPNDIIIFSFCVKQKMLQLKPSQWVFPWEVGYEKWSRKLRVLELSGGENRGVFNSWPVK